MPVIVVGADTAAGQAIALGLGTPGRDVRVFVSDPEVGAAFKGRGFKVASGDVSDDSHIEAAATHCFTAILVTEAARDARARSFATSESEVVSRWASAMSAAKVNRVIWVTDSPVPPTDAAEVATVDPRDTDFVEQVVALDDAQLRR